MLIENFYHITHSKITGNTASFDITLNADHEVYRGHFPEQAVVPGVIQLQIVRELFEQVLSTKLQITEVILAKYLRMITPDNHPVFTVRFEWSLNKAAVYLLNATVSNKKTVFTKLKVRLSLSTIKD